MNTPSSFTRPVHLSLGAYGRCPHHVAITQALTQSPSDPLLGIYRPLSCNSALKIVGELILTWL
jgi:hypothetical protein